MGTIGDELWGTQFVANDTFDDDETEKSTYYICLAELEAALIKYREFVQTHEMVRLV